MRKLFLPIVLFIANNFYGQIEFKKGLIEFNNGTTQSGYIDYSKIFTESIEFKKDMMAETSKFSINNIKNIDIEQGGKFIVKEVEIDSNRKKNLNESYESLSISLIKKFLVLEIVIQGTYNLYHSEINNVDYFFVGNNDKIDYLIYNQYNSSGNIKEDNTYKSQLTFLFKNTCVNTEIIERLFYSETDLKLIFRKANKCDNSLIEINNSSNDDSGLIVYGGVRNYLINAEKGSFFYSESIGFNSIAPTIGLEYKFNFNKLDLFLRADYSVFKTSFKEATKPTGSSSTIYDLIEYNGRYINLGLGLRYCLYERINNSFYFDGGLEYMINQSTDFKAIATTEESPNLNVYKNFEINNAFGLFFGTSYYYKRKIGVELRYSLPKNFIKNKTVVKQSYLSLMLLYKVF